LNKAILGSQLYQEPYRD